MAAVRIAWLVALTLTSGVEGASALSVATSRGRHTAHDAPMPTIRPGAPVASHAPLGRLAAARGGALGLGLLGAAVASAVRSVVRLLRLQLLILALATVWPIPLVLCIYWLMHVWFGAEGTSMIAFTGIR